MSRSLEPTKTANPSKRFLEWKSNEQCFQFWDKDAKENKRIDLPFKFMKLAEYHTIKGFHDDSQSGIYANEVKYIGKEILNVRSFNGGEIAKGLYKEIKGDILSAGGHYTKSVYIMTPEFEIWNLQMKGSVVSAWGDFSNEMRQRLNDEWVVVESFEKKKKGATNYTVPVFKSELSLSDAEWEKAKENFEILQDYFKQYFDPEKEQNEADKVEFEQKEKLQKDDEDDLPF